MIEHLRGTATAPDVVATPGGVSYRLVCSFDLPVGEEVGVSVETVWAKDTGPTLYGFASATERDVFTALVKVPSVGPAMAMALLRDVGVPALAAACAAGDPAVLRKARGVGATAALRVVTLARLPASASEVTEAPRVGEIATAVAALGFDEAATRRAAAEVLGSHPEAADADVVAAVISRLGA